MKLVTINFSQLLQNMKLVTINFSKLRQNMKLVTINFSQLHQNMKLVKIFLNTNTINLFIGRYILTFFSKCSLNIF